MVHARPINAHPMQGADMPGIALTVSGKADQALTSRLATEIIDLTSYKRH